MAVATWDLAGRDLTRGGIGGRTGRRSRPVSTRPTPAAGARRRGPSTRTRRARARSVALLTVLAPLAVLAVGALPEEGAMGAGTGVVGASPAPAVVVVAPGDTVWGLAADHAPAGADLHRYVAEVLAHNGVRAGGLRPGDALEFPRR